MHLLGAFPRPAPTGTLDGLYSVDELFAKTIESWTFAALEIHEGMRNEADEHFSRCKQEIGLSL